jgi:hypothetical protein
MLIAFCSDFTRHRFVFTLIPISVAIAGFGILITVHHDHKLEYAGLFLVAMGAYSAMPVIVCWFTMNLGGHHRRAVGTAWQVGFGNIGGIIATYAFLSTDAPYYKKGYTICLAFLCLSAASCCAYAVAVLAANRKRDKSPTDVGLTEYEKTELGVSYTFRSECGQITDEGIGYESRLPIPTLGGLERGRMACNFALHCISRRSKYEDNLTRPGILDTWIQLVRDWSREV